MHPRRLPFALVVASCLCFAACGERPAVQVPPPAIPDEVPPAAAAPVVAPTASAVAPLPASLAPLHFSSDDARLGSEVGQRMPGAGLVADGRAGWLVYGPYVHLDAGRYEARFEGSVDAGHEGPLHLDIASDKGRTVVTAVELASAALADPSAGGALAVLPFELAAGVDDIEARVQVEASSRVTVSGIEIRQLP
jgi:hypothetical protein